MNQATLVTEDDKKREFARLLAMSPANPFEAAQVIYPQPSLMGLALKISQEWPKDPIVVAEIKATEDGLGLEELLNFSKRDYCQTLLTMASKADDASAVKLMALYADIMGYRKKAQDVEATTVNNNTVTNNVLLIDSCGEDDLTWERRMQGNQRALKDAARG